MSGFLKEVAKNNRLFKARIPAASQSATSLLPPVRESPPTGCRQIILSRKTLPSVKETAHTFLSSPFLSYITVCADVFLGLFGGFCFLFFAFVFVFVTCISTTNKKLNISVNKKTRAPCMLIVQAEARPRELRATDVC